MDTSKPDIFAGPAEPGKVWVLTCTSSGGSRETITTVNLYTDPRHAIAELARSLTAHGGWQSRRKTRPWLPVEPPADPFDLVRVYYAGRPSDDFVTDYFDLWPERIDATVGEYTGPERLLVGSYGEFLCCCGNTSGADGFGPCAADGRDEVYPTGQVRCYSCGRVIDEATGVITGHAAADA